MNDVYPTTPEQRVRELRHSHIGLALDLLYDGDVDAAYHAMLAGFHAQARVLGIRMNP